MKTLVLSALALFQCAFLAKAGVPALDDKCDEDSLIMYKVEERDYNNPLYFMQPEPLFPGIKCKHVDSYSASVDSLGNIVLGEKRAYYEHRYDSLGRLVEIPGAFISYDYDGNVLKIRYVNKDGYGDGSFWKNVEITYDGKYPVVRKTAYKDADSYEEDEWDYVESWTYDESNRIIRYVYGRGDGTIYKVADILYVHGYCDRMFRGISIKSNFNGELKSLSYHELATYDDAGRIIRTDTYDDYDRKNRIAEYEYRDSVSSFLNKETIYLMDGNRPVEKTVRSYDSHGEWVATAYYMISPDGEERQSGYEKYPIEYDDKGNITLLGFVSPRWCGCDVIEYTFY